MTIYHFKELKIKKIKYGYCDKCNKKYQESRTFSQTINPWNKNSDGSIKTHHDIYKELDIQADEWLKTPISDHACKPVINYDTLDYLTKEDISLIKDASEEIKTIILEAENKINNIKKDLLSKYKNKICTDNTDKTRLQKLIDIRIILDNVNSDYFYLVYKSHNKRDRKSVV